MNNDITSIIWQEPRDVVLIKENNKSLGISIVGGKLDIQNDEIDSNNSKNFICGIFVKHVLDNSPAGLNGTIKTGDRILKVNGIDLSQATHDDAIFIIKNAKSPVILTMQSLIENNNKTVNYSKFLVPIKLYLIHYFER